MREPVRCPKESLRAQLALAADALESVTRALHNRTEALRIAHMNLMELPKHESAAIRQCGAHWLRTCGWASAAALVAGVILGGLVL